MVRDEVEKKYDNELKVYKVRAELRKNMKWGYRKVRKVPQQGNSQRCLVFRQQFALTMLDLLDKKKRVISLDETWLNETNFTRRAWFPRDSPGTLPLQPVSPSLSMIAALDTDGRVYFSLSHAKTD